MTTTPKAVLEGMYAAEARYLAAGGPGVAEFGLITPFFAPDVVLHQAKALPYGGEWHRHSGLERFFLAMSRTWESFEMKEQTFLATESPLVLLTQVHVRARATGLELDFPILQTITIRQGVSRKSARSTGTRRRSPRPVVKTLSRFPGRQGREVWLWRKR